MSTFLPWASQVHRLPWQVDATEADNIEPSATKIARMTRKVRVLDADGHPVSLGGQPFAFVVPNAQVFVDPLVADLTRMVEVINAHPALLEGCRAGLRVASGEDEVTADELRETLAPFEEEGECP